MSFLISFEWDVWEPQGPVSVCPSSSEPKENGDGKPHGQVEDGRNWTLIYGAPLGSCVLAGRVPQQKPLWADSFRNARFGKPRGQAMGRRRRDTYSTVKPCEQKYSAAAVQTDNEEPSDPY
ncbi:hypothetical protein IFM46972_08723 [Aspergillus udagawae]|uniref:Uncharacterized protein n=1 Tax=Aspergillus udagawae TaxID=91492 RepID=A0A8H3S5S2_9EURO|nr:hypothetical protein IFM46972_08723 [Aspergillus udagawae]